MFLDRRSGFDRRRAPTGNALAATWERSLLHLRDRPNVLVAVLLLANLLSILDLLFTLWALQNGAVEANPVMRGLLDASPAVAAAVKVGMVAALTALIFAFRRYRLMLATAVFVLLAFFFLVIYHSYGMIALT